MTHTFWMVNAFTRDRFHGNPAGVFIVDDFLETNLMQAIAAELNWSQTAFVRLTKEPHNFELQAHIRWFSPRDETRFCGHATLASSHILRQLYPTVQAIHFTSLAGPLMASFTEESIILNLPARPLIPCSTPPAWLYQALSHQGVTPPLTTVLRDPDIFVVVLDNPEDLLTLRPDLTILATQPDVRAISVTTIGLQGYDFQSRYFAPKVGIPEDPVCGSSHTRLALYWGERLGKTHMRAFQASPRGGDLWVTVAGDRVQLQGEAVTVFKGHMMPVYKIS